LLSWLEHLELNPRPDEVVFELPHKRRLFPFIAHLLVLVAHFLVLIAHLLVLVVEEVEAFGQILDPD
jgi:hypothetical protein